MSPVANETAVHLTLPGAREITRFWWPINNCLRDVERPEGRSRVIDKNKQPTVAGAEGQRAWPKHRRRGAAVVRADKCGLMIRNS